MSRLLKAGSFNRRVNIQGDKIKEQHLAWQADPEVELLSFKL